MSVTGVGWLRGRMEVSIVFDQVSPPVGTVLPRSGDDLDRGPAVPFAGWLGLLAALEELIIPEER